MSNRRKIPHPAARLDGLTLAGSCCATELAITRKAGVNILKFMHDDDCAILGDDVDRREGARLQCHLALQAVLGPRAVSVVIS